MAAQPNPVQSRGPAPGQEALQELESLIAARDFERADHLLQRIVQSGAEAATTYFAAGKLYFDHQEWVRSAKWLQQALRISDSNDQCHLLLGLDWRQLNKPEGAEKEFLKATAQNPASDVNTYFAGHQLVLNGKFEAALPYLYKAVLLNPHRREALRAVAVAQTRLGNYGIAESYYRRALEIAMTSGQRDFADRVDLGFLLLLGHDPENLRDGLKLAREAAGMQPGSAEAHYLVGKASFKLDRFEEAIPELQKSAHLNPQDSKPHFLLAEIFDRTGHKDMAEKEREALSATKRRADQAGVATAGPVPPASAARLR